MKSESDIKRDVEVHQLFHYNRRRLTCDSRDRTVARTRTGGGVASSTGIEQLRTAIQVRCTVKSFYQLMPGC